MFRFAVAALLLVSGLTHANPSFFDIPECSQNETDCLLALDLAVKKESGLNQNQLKKLQDKAAALCKKDTKGADPYCAMNHGNFYKYVNLVDNATGRTEGGN